jgi:hypothetical protein
VRSNMVGLICSPMVGIGLANLPKSGRWDGGGTNAHLPSVPPALHSSSGLPTAQNFGPNEMAGDGVELKLVSMGLNHLGGHYMAFPTNQG